MKTTATIALILFTALSMPGNPIIPNRGVCDPQIHIFGDRAWLYATHDKSADNQGFVTEDWWVWSSDDLVTWSLESTIKPEQTYLRRPFSSCWATDAAQRNGKYYFYFSEANEQTGVMVAETPIGPWNDPLGKPLLESTLTPTHEYDISVFTDDDGVPYIVFGVWDYYIARLGEDMVSLAEKPRRIEIANPVGPYGPGKTDDKPFLHKYRDTYYMSWGVFYATAHSPYGPYTYRDTLLDDRSFAPGYAAPTWPHGYRQGRHGSFFTWHNQWYFAYCDISQTDNRFFRDTFISYVHYRENGEMARIRVDGIGVGQYDPTSGPIQVEDYFAAQGVAKVELPLGGFGIVPTEAASFVRYPNVQQLADQRSLTITFVGLVEESGPVNIEVALDPGPATKAIAEMTLPPVPFQQTATVRVDLDLPAGARQIILRFPAGSTDVAVDAITFSSKPVSELSPHRLATF